MLCLSTRPPTRKLSRSLRHSFWKKNPVLRRYVYGLDKVQVKVTGEGSDWWGQNIQKCVNMAYVHTDRLGSVVNLSDQYGRVPIRYFL